MVISPISRIFYRKISTLKIDILTPLYKGKNKFTTHTNTRVSTARTLFLRAFEIHTRHQRRERERSASYISVAGEEIKNIARYLT